MDELAKHLKLENLWLRKQVENLQRQLGEVNQGMVKVITGPEQQPAEQLEPNDLFVFPTHEFDTTVQPQHAWPRSDEWNMGPTPEPTPPMEWHTPGNDSQPTGKAD